MKGPTQVGRRGEGIYIVSLEESVCVVVSKLSSSGAGLFHKPCSLASVVRLFPVFIHVEKESSCVARKMEGRQRRRRFLFEF